MYGFEAMWPKGRTELDGRSMGDVWEHSALPRDGDGWSNLVPFHKLSQWMTYSLMEPLQVRREGRWGWGERKEGEGGERGGGGGGGRRRGKPLLCSCGLLLVLLGGSYMLVPAPPLRLRAR